MLKDYPIYFNNTELFKPEKWDESPEIIEKVNKTEAGTDSIVVKRAGKMNISCEFACTDEWKAFFYALSRLNSITVRMYDAEIEDYTEKTMRIREIKSSWLKGSEYLKSSNGLHTVTFNLIQF